MTRVKIVLRGPAGIVDSFTAPDADQAAEKLSGLLGPPERAWELRPGDTITVEEIEVAAKPNSSEDKGKPT